MLPSLATALRTAGFRGDALHDRLGIRMPDDVGILNHTPMLERLRGDRSPVATLIRLFFLEAEESRRQVVRALSARVFTDCHRAKLLRVRGDRVQAALRLDAIGDQYFLSDRRFQRPVPGALGLGGRDPVYPPGADSLLLRDAVTFRDGAAVLDLCTGSGVQVVQQAGIAARLVAVDVNPRAVGLARANADLNGVERFEGRCGDLFSPVRRERFDVVIANPPFVTSPYAKGPSYHAGGATGDRVLRRVIAGLDGHLHPGGRAFAVTHLGLRRGTDVSDAARRWFAAFSGRALVVTVETGTAVDLAAAQALFAIRRGAAPYAAEIRRWLAYLRTHRIDRIAVLLVGAERAGKRHLEVVDGQPRILPLPLAPAPDVRIRTWLDGITATPAAPSA
ncbi:methyltransferase [Candidatus Binatia bacterium]|nr:methyltransferase [Candidatus Binatia bacterium]